ncbi:MAG: NFACT RNA binding domain-containing protein [Butyribacter sp.]|nr:NFACT RNA binding domain-containing protein [bacterium]MDY3855320.1 NFACT RNA binding domain-containing protein [Butyribacter sp.]
MAFDGIVIASLVSELNAELTGGRITKIAQTEADKLQLTIKNSYTDETGNTTRTQNRLVISVNPSLPLLYLTPENQPSPLQAPTFCMVLRKHLNNCKIKSITQAGLERVICFHLEHLNEMGDLCQKNLYVELMGKHSNIIFCDETDTIIDSIKHISLLVSSVREVLPGRKYFIPNTQKKLNPLTISEEEFMEHVFSQPAPIDKALYRTLTGFSAVMANELLYRSSLTGHNMATEFSDMEKLHLYRNFCEFMELVRHQEFSPNIVYHNDEPVEFAGIRLSSYENLSDYKIVPAENTSQMLYDYYHTKESLGRIRQKSADLRRITHTALERSQKKYDLQSKQLKDTQKRDKYKVYGELLTTYGYELHGGEKSLTCENYYTNSEITIPLDETKSAVENAKHYFEKYTKLKRTYEALTEQIRETKEEIEHLNSISNALDIARFEEDLTVIRKELSDAGYIKKHLSGKKQNTRNLPKSKPLHYISSDGFDMYVGKNNYQNDELTFKIATGNDWWFHAKQNAGSHVIVKTQGKELPDATFEEAARLAAYYSKSRDQEKAEIDYVQKKHIKKPNGSKPGFVVYYTNYSMTIPTDITGIKEVTE